MTQSQCIRVSMVSDRETDGSHQLSFLCFDHVDYSPVNCKSPTCSSKCRQLVQQKPFHELSCLCAGYSEGNFCKTIVKMTVDTIFKQSALVSLVFRILSLTFTLSSDKMYVSCSCSKTIAIGESLHFI